MSLEKAYYYLNQPEVAVAEDERTPRMYFSTCCLDLVKKELTGAERAARQER